MLDKNSYIKVSNYLNNQFKVEVWINRQEEDTVETFGGFIFDQAQSKKIVILGDYCHVGLLNVPVDTPSIQKCIFQAVKESYGILIARPYDDSWMELVCHALECDKNLFDRPNELLERFDPSSPIWKGIENV